MTYSLDIFGYKIVIFHCFVFFHSSIRISIPWLFCTCFHTKIFSKCNFCTHYNVGSSTILIELLKFRNNFRITVTSSSNLLWRLSMWAFLNIILRYYFSLETILQDVAKNNSTKGRSMQKLRRHWSMQHENSQKGKCKVYRYKLRR